VILRRWPYRLHAVNPDRGGHEVTLRSKTPLDDARDQLIKDGYIVLLDRSPDQTVRSSVPMRITRKPAEPEPEAVPPDVHEEVPTTVLEPSAPDLEPQVEPSEPTGAPLSKRQRLATLLADVPASDPRGPSRLAEDLAVVVDLHPSTARRYIAEIRKAAQTGAGDGRTAQGLAA